MNDLEVVILNKLYGTMQSIENKLGGGEGIEGLYGSINQSGMKRIIHCLQEFCHLDSSSHLVDIGAGLGRPLLHALVSPGIASAHGIEIDRIKCDKAHAFLRQTALVLSRRVDLKHDLPIPTMTCAPIEDILTLEPFTHAYSFWEGVPADARAAFGKLFAESRTLHSVAVVQRCIRSVNPEIVMEEDYSFGQVELVGSFPVSMSGSGQTFTCYVFRKKLGKDNNNDDSSSSDVSMELPHLAVDTPPSSVERPIRTLPRTNIINKNNNTNNQKKNRKAAGSTVVRRTSTKKNQAARQPSTGRVRKPTYKLIEMYASMRRKVADTLFLFNKGNGSTRRRGLLSN